MLAQVSGDVIGARANRRSVHVSLSSIIRFLQLYVLAAAPAHGLYWHIRCSCMEKERKNQSNHYPTIMIQLNKFRCLVKVKYFGSLHTLRYFHVLYIILMYSQLTILAWFTISAIHHLVNALFPLGECNTHVIHTCRQLELLTHNFRPPGTRHCLVDRGSMGLKACLTLLHITSSWDEPQTF